jgi:excisionase family DNA binding protein
MTEQHLTVAQLAERYQLSTKSVLRRIHEGDIRAINVGTTWRPNYRISARELERWERSRAA